MANSLSVTRQKAYTAPRLQIVGPRPRSWGEAFEQLDDIKVLRRWHRILEASGGDREHALRVWNAIGRAELNA